MKRIILGLLILSSLYVCPLLFAAAFDLECSKESGVAGSSIRYMEISIKPCFLSTGYHDSEKKKAKGVLNELKRMCPRAMSKSQYTNSRYCE